MLTALLIGLARVAAASADATHDRRALVMLRALAYDTNLDARIGDEVRLVIVYAEGERGVAEAVQWTTAFANVRKVKIGRRSVVVSAHKFATATALARTLRELRPAALVSCDGLGAAIAVPALAKITRASRVLSFSTRESDVARGLAVGIVRGGTRDDIVINRAAIAAEGVKFDAGLLQLARTAEERR